MRTYTGSAALATVALLSIAGHAHAQGFSDDFNDGDLDGWGSPRILFGQHVDSFLVSADSGALRMEGVGSESSQEAEVVFLPLAAPEQDRGIYRNGSVSFDADLDPYTIVGAVARMDEAAGTYVLMSAQRTPAGGFIAVRAMSNGQGTMQEFQQCDFSFDHLHIDAAWMGDTVSIRVTNRDTLETQSVSGADASVVAGGDTGLADSRGRPDIFEFGATFDDFWICIADINGDGVLNVFDFLAFQTLFSGGDPAADIDGNGLLNIFDFLAFQTAFGNGC